MSLVTTPSWTAHEGDAERVEAWIDEAVRGGATSLVGGRRHGSLVWPTLVLEPPEGSKLARDEIFGPVLAVDPVESADKAGRSSTSCRAAWQPESLRATSIAG